jgi:thioredoxin-like negative regulator of GroEL
MGLHAEAKQVLEHISEDMKVIENTNYYNLCLFYKGDITLNELTKDLDDNPGGAAIAYGVANWYYVEGDTAEAKKRLKALTATNSWAGFGYIAAESDLFRWP